MKWSIFVCLLACLAKYSEGGALRCPPGVSDSSCTEEKNEVGTQEEINLPVIVAPIENDSGEDNFVEIIYMMKLTTICKPNKEFMKDCNPCKCSADGLSYTCTRNECMEVDKEVDKEVEVFMESEGADHIERHSVCRARETFNISCNSCRCNSLGTDYSCTNKLCPLPPDVEVFGRQDLKPATPYTGDDDLEDLRVTKKACRPDEVFELDCNTCRCNPDGKSYSCTRRACEDPGDKQERKAKVCIPDEWFREDCNWCLCDATGLVYSCERKGCSVIDDRSNLPPIHSADINESKGKLELVEKSNSEKRSSKHLDTPVVVAPDLKPATPYTGDDDLEIARSLPNATKAQVCVANRMFVLDCNTCWCNEDGTSYVCTRRTCVPLLPDEEPDLGGIPAEDLRVTKKECRPDEVFELDCNTCRCNPDGKSYSCTRRACEDPEDKQKVTLSRKVRSIPMDEMPKAKACQPGQEFRMDCNTCLCDNQGLDFSCTRNDCNAVNNNHEVRRKREVSDPIEMKCSPGSVFNQDCNVCKCSEDGNHATCTIKQCKPKNETESEVRLAESDPDFRCTAGEQFKRDCNDCTCQADGKDVYCTVRYCD